MPEVTRTHRALADHLLTAEYAERMCPSTDRETLEAVTADILGVPVPTIHHLVDVAAPTTPIRRAVQQLAEALAVAGEGA